MLKNIAVLPKDLNISLLFRNDVWNKPIFAYIGRSTAKKQQKYVSEKNMDPERRKAETRPECKN